MDTTSAGGEREGTGLDKQARPAVVHTKGCRNSSHGPAAQWVLLLLMLIQCLLAPHRQFKWLVTHGRKSDYWARTQLSQSRWTTALSLQIRTTRGTDGQTGGQGLGGIVRVETGYFFEMGLAVLGVRHIIKRLGQPLFLLPGHARPAAAPISGDRPPYPYL